MHHIKTSLHQVAKWFGFAQAAGVHKPIIKAVKITHKAATHPMTQKVAKAGFHFGARTAVTGYRLLTHPTTAKITQKAWLHGTSLARHAGRFMVKVALKGFKLRG